MKHRVVFWLLVTLTPVLAGALLALGSQWNEALGGRLLQVLGAFLALAWVTAMFLIMGVAVTRVFGLGGADESTEQKGESTTLPPPRRKAA